jgi:hypothetical protein
MPDDKKPVGRPSKMTNTTLKKLKEAYLGDHNDEEACFIAGISLTTLYDFQSRYPRFADLKAKWKQGPTVKARAKIVKAISKDDGNTSDAWRWVEKKRRDEFGNVQTIDFNANVTVAEAMDIDKLKALVEHDSDNECDSVSCDSGKCTCNKNE